MSLYDDVDVRVRTSGLSIEIEGEGADLAGAGEDHLVVRAMRKTFAALGSQPPGLGLRCVNRIPHGRGLGSSAAAIVAGILAARALVPAGPGVLPDEDLRQQSGPGPGNNGVPDRQRGGQIEAHLGWDPDRSS